MTPGVAVGRNQTGERLEVINQMVGDAGKKVRPWERGESDTGAC